MAPKYIRHDLDLTDMQDSDIPVEKRRVATFTVDERNSPCPVNTGPILKGGDICLFIPETHIETTQSHPRGNTLRAKQQQGYTQLLRRQISLFESLTGHCAALIETANKELCSYLSLIPNSNINDILMATPCVLDSVYNLHVEQEKAKRNGTSTPRETFDRNMIELACWATVRMDVIVEILPAADCVINDTVGDDRPGQRTVSATKICAFLKPPTDLDRNTAVKYSCISWDHVLRKYIGQNRMERTERDTRRKAKSGDRGYVKANDIAMEAEAQDQEFRRPMLNLFSGWQYLREYAVLQLGMNDNGEVDKWLSVDNSSQHMINGHADWRVGPWMDKIKASAPGSGVSEVFGLALLLRRASPDGISPLLCKDQLENDEMYLGHQFRDSNGQSMSTGDRRRVMQHPEYNHLLHGVDYAKLFSTYPCTRRCVFLLDNRTIDGVTWLTSRDPFSHFWKHTLIKQQTTRIEGGSRILPSHMGIPINGIDPHAHLDKSITRDMITAPVGVPSTNGNVRIDCTSPVEILADAFRPVIDRYTKDMEELLQHGMAHPMDDTDKRTPRGKTLGQIQAQAAHDLITSAQTMACACDGVRAVFNFIDSPDGLFGEADGSRAVSRCEVRPVACDFSAGCNATAFVMESAEFLGTSSLHGVFSMTVISLIDAMIPTDDILLNLFCQGGQATGKSYVFKSITDLSIPMTIINEQHETEQSEYDEGGNRSMEVHLYQEFDHGIASTTDGYAAKGDRGTTKRSERLKQTMSDHTAAVKTAVCENGVRSTRIVDRKVWTTYWWASNIPASSLPSALLSRIAVMTAGSTHRDGHTIPDYTAWGKGPSHRDDTVFTSFQMYIRQLQAFAGLIGNLIFADIVRDVDMTAFSQVSFRMNEHLHLTGGEMQPRTVAKAKKVARVLVYASVFYKEFCGENGMYGKGTDCSIQDLFVGYRARILHASLVVSESMAMTAMMHAYDGRQGDSVTAVCKAIMYMVCNDRSFPSPYQQMFVEHNESPSKEATRRSHTNDMAPPVIDLNYMYIFVGNGQDTRMHAYCTRVMQTMKLTQKVAMSADQIRCTLESMTDPEREWATCKHHELDLLIPSEAEMDTNGWTSTPGLDTLYETLYSTLHADAVQKMRVEGVPMSTLTSAQAAWIRMGGGTESLYFPFPTTHGKIVHSRSCNLSRVAETGYMIMSTAAVRAQAMRCIGDTTTPFKWMSSCNTVAGMPVVRSVTPSPSSYGAQTPHLPPTGRQMNRPDQVNRMSNPYYCSASTWARRTGEEKIPSSRSKRTMMVPPFQTLDSYVVENRCSITAAGDPTAHPAVYVLFNADPSAINAIVGPGILDVLCGEDCAFLALSDTNKRKAAKELIESGFLDLVRPVVKDGDGWTPLPEEDGQSADEFCFRMTNRLVALVVDLSNSKGVGRMRENMIDMKSGIDEGEESYTIQDMDMDSDTRSRTHGVLANGIKRMEAEDKRRAKCIRDECRAHTASDMGGKYKSFIEEFRTIERPREQTLVGYMEITRATSKRLMAIQHERTAVLRKSEQEASQPRAARVPDPLTLPQPLPPRPRLTKRKRVLNLDRQPKRRSPVVNSPPTSNDQPPPFNDNMLEFDPDTEGLAFPDNTRLEFPPDQDALGDY